MRGARCSARLSESPIRVGAHCAAQWEPLGRPPLLAPRKWPSLSDRRARPGPTAGVSRRRQCPPLPPLSHSLLLSIPLTLSLSLSLSLSVPAAGGDSDMRPGHGTGPGRLSESPIRVVFPSRLSESSIRVVYPNLLHRSGSTLRARRAHAAGAFESPIRVAHPSHQSESPIRVAGRRAGGGAAGDGGGAAGGPG